MIFDGLYNMPISLSYSSFFFLFRESTVLTEQGISLETVKGYLKYSYPGLQLFLKTIL